MDTSKKAVGNKRREEIPAIGKAVAPDLPIFFKSAAEFRRWLNKHHAAETELLLGFHSLKSGLPGIGYAEALDEALCVGWIDGVRKNFDSTSYTIRFTPRKAGSIWSLVNVRHVERLTAAGRMTAAGIQTFAVRAAHKIGIYSFEVEEAEFSPALEKIFRANQPAWAFWLAQPPGYRRLAKHRVMRAKLEETRLRRLAKLIEVSARGLRED
ncbi:MAG TPA: YdeI/OmpD-associated family protein [Usitatibacteraceae bacterium]